jgi:hypothetical protein
MSVVGHEMGMDDVGKVAFEAGAGLLRVLAWSRLRR